jgi:hypothetical protein
VSFADPLASPGKATICWTNIATWWLIPDRRRLTAPQSFFNEDSQQFDVFWMRSHGSGSSHREALLVTYLPRFNIQVEKDLQMV